MSNDAFVPVDYAAPSSGGGFSKIELGENRFRILSSPFLMWVTWNDGKATKIKYLGDANKPAKPAGENASVKHVWGLIVWNYQTKAIEVLELDKATLITPLLSHANDTDWGHPKKYDVIFKKEGSGREGTKYSFIAKPHSEPSDEIIQAYTENPIDLSQLVVEGGSVFINSAGNPSSTPPASNTAKTVTFENWSKGDEIPAGYKLDGDKLVKNTLPF
jgi:hypothetical protein